VHSIVSPQLYCRTSSIME